MSGLRKIPIFIADAFSPAPFGKKLFLFLFLKAIFLADQN